MPDSEHVRRLLESSDTEWNQWRAASSEIRPDLSNAEFTDVVLVGQNLSAANLEGAWFERCGLAYTCFMGANLAGAAFGEVSLRCADFDDSKLHRTTFRQSDMELATFAGAEVDASMFLGASLVMDGADFRGAKLTSCRLDEARLRKASFQRAVLRQVSLRRAKFDEAAFEMTVLVDCDVRAAALDGAFHLGPSVIDHRTLARSGEISRPFLRGCGFSEEMLGSLPRNMGPIDNLYIAYDSADGEAAVRLRGDLEAAGVRCWLYCLCTKLPEYRWEMEEPLLGWDRVLLVLSEPSEYRSAMERLAVETLEGRPDRFAPTPNLFAVQIDGGSGGHVADSSGKLPIDDLSAWRTDPAEYERAVARLVQRIRGG